MPARGLEACQNKLRAAIRKIEGATIEGVEMAGRYLIDATLPDVPVDTGALRRSATVVRVGDAKRPTVAVGFRTKYALKVHENLRVRHRIGQAKYLEKHMVEDRLAIVQKIADRVKRK